MNPQTREQIDARLPAYITGARRERIILTVLECQQFENDLHKKDFDSVLIWLEDNLLLRKELFGQQEAQKYIDEVCRSWIRILHASEEDVQELRSGLDELLRLMDGGKT